MKLICPNCKAEANCSRTEDGPWDQYIGLYVLECATCGYKQEETIHEGYTGYQTDPPICPFCHYDHSLPKTQNENNPPKDLKQ